MSARTPSGVDRSSHLNSRGAATWTGGPAGSALHRVLPGLPRSTTEPRSPTRKETRDGRVAGSRPGCAPGPRPLVRPSDAHRAGFDRRPGRRLEGTARHSQPRTRRASQPSSTQTLAGMAEAELKTVRLRPAFTPGAALLMLVAIGNVVLWMVARPPTSRRAGTPGRSAARKRCSSSHARSCSRRCSLRSSVRSAALTASPSGTGAPRLLAFFSCCRTSFSPRRRRTGTRLGSARVSARWRW